MLLTKKQLSNLIRESLLLEVSFKQATQSLYSNRTKKIVKNLDYHDRLPPGYTFDYYLEVFRNSIVSLVPEDIEDNERGLALLWLIKLASKDLEFAYDLTLDDPYAIDTSLRQNIELYFQWKRFMSERDLMRVADAEHLSSTVDDARHDIEAYQEKQSYMDAEEGMEPLYEDGTWQIIAVHNKGAACELGKGTNWCTAAPGLNYFADYYTEDDPLIYVKDKRSGDRYQLHFGSEQFMDVNDYSIDLITLLPILDVLANIIKYDLDDKAQTILDRNLAKADVLDDEDFERLADSVDLETLEHLAKRHDVPLHILETLAKSEFYQVRGAVAQNRRASSDILDAIISSANLNDDRWPVVTALGNPNVPIKHLINAHDADPHRRQAVAQNINTPSEILIKLAYDEHSGQVRNEALANPSLPEQAIRDAAEYYGYDNSELYGIARNTSAPADILHNFAVSKHKNHQSYVAANDATPKEILGVMLSDPTASYQMLVNIAYHPNATKEMLVKLSMHEKDWVSGNAEKNLIQRFGVIDA